MPTARIAPYCFHFADALMEMLLMILNAAMTAIMPRKPYTNTAKD